MWSDLPVQFDNQTAVIAGELNVVLRAQQEFLLIERKRLGGSVTFGKQDLACFQDVSLFYDHVEVDEASQRDVAVSEESEHGTFVRNCIDACTGEARDQAP